ncbi:Hypothetical predicted protein, partial [Pelobates cultripes]
MRPRSTWTRVMGREDVMAWHVWLPMELVLLYLLMIQMLQNSLDGASQCRWTMTRSILQKQPKSFLRERTCISLDEDKTERKMPQEQANFLMTSFRENLPFSSLKHFKCFRLEKGRTTA